MVLVRHEKSNRSCTLDGSKGRIGQERTQDSRSPSQRTQGRTTSQGNTHKTVRNTHNNHVDKPKRFGYDVVDMKNFSKDQIVLAQKASAIIRYAMDRGFFHRPEVCENCLRYLPTREPFNRPRIIGHHIDYNYPLVVMWLCQPCHRAWHLWNNPVPSQVPPKVSHEEWRQRIFALTAISPTDTSSQETVGPTV
jgi:hypothetical protein